VFTRHVSASQRDALPEKASLVLAVVIVLTGAMGLVPIKEPTTSKIRKAVQMVQENRGTIGSNPRF
jgi:hypothetical protein